MQVINNGVLFITISSEAESMATRDAESWAARLKKEVEAQKDASAKLERSVQMKRDIIAERMPHVWEQLVSVLDSHVKAFNETFNPKRKLACHRLAEYEVMVRPDALNEIVFMRYNAMDRSIVVRTGSRGEKYSPEALMNGSGEIELRGEYSSYLEKDLDLIVSSALERGIKSVSHALDAS
jgi:hypothetical protein